VLVSALRSRRGASFELLRRLPLKTYRAEVTVPMLMEDVEVLHRDGMVPISASAVDAVRRLLPEDHNAHALDMLAQSLQFDQVDGFDVKGAR